MRLCLATPVVGLAILLGFALTACGEGGVGDACTTQSECGEGLGCSGPDDPPVCGIPPQRGCADESACLAGETCHAVPDPCSPSGYGSACRPACTSDAACQGECVDGACRPLGCPDDAACPAHQRCDPAARSTGPVWEAPTGCVTIACDDATPCGTGLACVNGICQRGEGSCVVERVVP